jgi:hypothetical protein
MTRVDLRDEHPHERDAGHLLQHRQCRLPRLAVDGAA